MEAVPCILRNGSSVPVYGLLIRQVQQQQSHIQGASLILPSGAAETLALACGQLGQQRALNPKGAVRKATGQQPQQQKKSSSGRPTDANHHHAAVQRKPYPVILPRRTTSETQSTVTCSSSSSSSSSGGGGGGSGGGSRTAAVNVNSVFIPAATMQQFQLQNKVVLSGLPEPVTPTQSSGSATPSGIVNYALLSQPVLLQQQKTSAANVMVTVPADQQPNSSSKQPAPVLASNVFQHQHSDQQHNMMLGGYASTNSAGTTNSMAESSSYSGLNVSQPSVSNSMELPTSDFDHFLQEIDSNDLNSLLQDWNSEPSTTDASILLSGHYPSSGEALLNMGASQQQQSEDRTKEVIRMGIYEPSMNNRPPCRYQTVLTGRPSSAGTESADLTPSSGSYPQLAPAAGVSGADLDAMVQDTADTPDSGIQSIGESPNCLGVQSPTQAFIFHSPSCNNQLSPEAALKSCLTPNGGQYSLTSGYKATQASTEPLTIHIEAADGDPSSVQGDGLLTIAMQQRLHAEAKATTTTSSSSSIQACQFDDMPVLMPEIRPSTMQAGASGKRPCKAKKPTTVIKLDQSEVFTSLVETKASEISDKFRSIYDMVLAASEDSKKQQPKEQQQQQQQQQQQDLSKVLTSPSADPVSLVETIVSVLTPEKLQSFTKLFEERVKKSPALLSAGENSPSAPVSGAKDQESRPELDREQRFRASDRTVRMMRRLMEYRVKARQMLQNSGCNRSQQGSSLEANQKSCTEVTKLCSMLEDGLEISPASSDASSSKAAAGDETMVERQRPLLSGAKKKRRHQCVAAKRPWVEINDNPELKNVSLKIRLPCIRSVADCQDCQEESQSQHLTQDKKTTAASDCQKIDDNAPSERYCDGSVENLLLPQSFVRCPLCRCWTNGAASCHRCVMPDCGAEPQSRLLAHKSSLLPGRRSRLENMSTKSAKVKSKSVKAKLVKAKAVKVRSAQSAKSSQKAKPNSSSLKVNHKGVVARPNRALITSRQRKEEKKRGQRALGTNGTDFKRPLTYTAIERNKYGIRAPAHSDSRQTEVCDCKPPKDDNEPGCGSQCLNRAVSLECDPDKCPCGSRCSNQAIQRGATVPLEVFPTNDGRGFGVKTKCAIEPDVFVTEYVGEVIRLRAYQNRIHRRYKNVRGDAYYAMYLEDGWVIDSTLYGSVSRFINHSCDPNCMIEKWLVGGEFRLGVFTKRRIEAGEELTYDYKSVEYETLRKCLCGSQNCRGYIGYSVGKMEKEKNKKVSTRGSRSVATNDSVEEEMARKPASTKPKKVSVKDSKVKRTAPGENKKAEKPLDGIVDSMVSVAQETAVSSVPQQIRQNCDDQTEIREENTFNSIYRDYVRRESMLTLAKVDLRCLPEVGHPETMMIRCLCATFKPDGAMVKCNGCQYWQHSDCANQRPGMADDYLCQFCLEPSTLNWDEHKQDMLLMSSQSSDESSIDIQPNQTCYRMLTNDKNIKIRVGDFVYVRKDKRSNAHFPASKCAVLVREEQNVNCQCDDISIIRVIKLYTTETDERFLVGNYYVRPHETVCYDYEKFHRNEVFFSNIHRKAPLAEVVGRCLVLDVGTYCRGRSKVPFFDERDVYFCEYRVDSRQGLVRRSTFRCREKLTLEEYTLDLFATKLVIKRDFFPFRVDDGGKNAKKRKLDGHSLSLEQSGS